MLLYLNLSSYYVPLKLKLPYVVGTEALPTFVPSETLIRCLELKLSSCVFGLKLSSYVVGADTLIIFCCS